MNKPTLVERVGRMVRPIYTPLSMARFTRAKLLRTALTAKLMLAPAAGCVERKLTVDTEPEGSLVYLNNQEFGRSPVTRRFTWYGNYDVQLRDDQTSQAMRTSSQLTAPWWQWPPFDLVAEVIPVWFVDERKMSFSMPPAADEAPDAQAMLGRASELRGRLESSEHTRQPTSRPVAR